MTHHREGEPSGPTPPTAPYGPSAFGRSSSSTLIVDGVVEPLEMGHLPYRKGPCEDHAGQRGPAKHRNRKWRKRVADVVERLVAALEPNDVVIGGGNVKKLKEQPPGWRAGPNANAFQGRIRPWQEPTACGSDRG